MASMEKMREKKDGTGVYRIRWRTADGEPHQATVHGWTAAGQFKTNIERELQRGTYIDPEAGKEPFKQYAERWRIYQDHRSSTRRATEGRLRRHVYPHIGNRRIASIRHSDMQGLKHILEQTLQKSTVRLVLKTVSAVFNSAVKDKAIVESPMEHVSPSKVTRKTLIIPTIKQVHKVANDERLTACYQALPLLAAMSGLRRGELLALRLDTVLLRFRTIEVRPDTGQLLPRQGDLPARLAPPKTEASARTVPIGRAAIDVLKKHMAKFPPNPDDGFGGLIFTTPTGKPVNDTTLSHQLRPIMADLGFPPRSGLHLFRHFFVSACIAQGATVKDIQEWVGHTSATETWDTYGHLWPNGEDTARVAIDGVFGYPVEQHETAKRDEEDGGAPVTALR